jgi:hypothetical protein
MSILTRGEFAALCGDDIKSLNVYISRDKVRVGENGIDTKNPINKIHLQKRKAFNAAKKAGQIDPKSIPAYINPDAPALPFVIAGDYTPTETHTEKLKRQSDNNDDETIAFYQKKKLMGEAEKAVLGAEREQLLLDKAAGKLLPLDMVTNIHKLYARNIFVNFENALETLATKFCEIMAGGDQRLYTRVLQELKLSLDAVITKAGNETQEDIDTLIEDYSETRHRGERKI